jgi:hypothetical protein
LSGLLRDGKGRGGAGEGELGARVGAVAAASAPQDGRCGQTLLRAAEGRLASPAIHSTAAAGVGMDAVVDVAGAVAEAG